MSLTPLRRLKPAERGMALAYVLGLLSIMGIMAIGFRTNVTLDGRKNLRADREAIALANARSGLEYAKALLQNTPEDFRKTLRDPLVRRSSEELFPGVKFRYTAPENFGASGIQPANSRLNVNVASRMELARIPSVSDDLAAAIALLRAQGPIQGWQELYALPSWPRRDGAPDQRLGQYLCILGDGQINVNSAPWIVIHAATGLERDSLKEVARYRNGRDGEAGTADDRLFSSVDDFRSRLPGGTQLGFDGLTVETSSYLVWVTGSADLPAPPRRIRQEDGSDALRPRTVEASVVGLLTIEEGRVELPLVLNITPRPLL